MSKDSTRPSQSSLGSLECAFVLKAHCTSHFAPYGTVAEGHVQDSKLTQADAGLTFPLEPGNLGLRRLPMPQLLRTSNPALNDKAFRTDDVAFGQETMTVNGTVNKTGILLILALITSVWTWNLFLHSRSPETIMPLAAVGGIGGFIVGMVTVFKKKWSPITAPMYALLEGLLLGSVSALFEVRFPGLPIQAVSLTFGVLVVMLLAYRWGVIPVNNKLRMGIVAATGGIFLIYFAEFILGFFGIHFTTINSASPIGIGFSVVVVVIASLNLVLDFDFIERGAQAGAPKYMEWYGAFGLIVTLIWLYFEMLRLLSKIRER